MREEFYEHKKKDTKKWIATLVAFVLLFGSVGVLTANAFGAFDKEKEHQEEQLPDEDNNSTEEVSGEFKVKTATSAGMKLGVSRMAAMASTTLNNDVSALAEDSYTLTATVSPADATYDGIEWKVAWKNASSSFASGKTVTDYVTVTPTAEGSATATVECKQAFGEQIIVTANVKGYENIKATCTVEYLRKYEGTDVRLNVNWTAQSGIAPITWDLTHDNLNATVDFIDMPIGLGSGFLQTLVFAWDDPANTKKTFEQNWSNTYTKDNGSSSYLYYVAPTAEYIAALNYAGLSPTANAETFVRVTEVTFVNILFDSLGASNISEEKAIKLIQYLHEHSNEEMLRFKYHCVGGADGATYETVYNLKFSADSTDPIAIAGSVSLNSSELVF